MSAAELTRYLVALRSWYDRERRARMAGKTFNESMPTRPGEQQ